jgi:hypothetical protein
MGQHPREVWRGSPEVRALLKMAIQSTAANHLVASDPPCYNGLMNAFAPKMPQDLTPGRTCGECSVCCEYFAIDTAELQKVQDVLCPHCIRPAGCGIYDSRPLICREWHCGWRQLTTLDWRWRPDQSGVLVEAHGIGPSLTGVKFNIVGGPEVIGWPPLVAYAADLVEVGVLVSVLARGTIGHVLSMMRLNDRLMSAAQARDRQRVRRELAAAQEACLAYQGLSAQA